ncbi:hypothetical protein PMAYCL1PPCAC_04566 [Pristionchus mayeri]|uniref:Uncharacterized protein n=1 Tax=Pristionchus mayeri TaxID=1317129 RepID=A0AAN5CAW1_9BILA|nr:hypothetical protein PMAYCL1PPCAC_04566 [Pristionchus mayeri]
MLKASCDSDCPNPDCKRDSVCTAQVNADLEASLVKFAQRWQLTEKQYDELVQVYAKLSTADDPRLRQLRNALCMKTARMESGAETRARLAKMVNSIHEVAQYALETEMRRFAFDCPGEMRGIAAELQKELGYDQRKLNNKEFIYTIPIVTHIYMRKVKGMCCCVIPCHANDV